MYKILVVGDTIEERDGLAGHVEDMLREGSRDDQCYLPQFEISRSKPSELKHRTQADYILISGEVLSEELVLAQEIREIFPAARIACWVESSANQVELSSQLARSGVDDIISSTISSSDFQSKIILASSRSSKPASGQLVTCIAAKGGTGLTSTVAALADAAAFAGLKVCVVDTDTRTKDLSLFLKVRPFESEVLTTLLYGKTPINGEAVASAVVPSKATNLKFDVLPVPQACQEFGSAEGAIGRQFCKVLEILDESYDVVFIDTSDIQGKLLNLLYLASNSVVLVVSNDSCNMFSALEEYRTIIAKKAPSGRLLILPNLTHKDRLSAAEITNEFLEMVQAAPESMGEVIPHVETAWKWPATGRTLFELAGKAYAASISRNLELIGLVPEREQKRMGLFKRVFARLPTLPARKLLPAPQPKIEAPREEPPAKQAEANSRKSRNDVQSRDQAPASGVQFVGKKGTKAESVLPQGESLDEFVTEARVSRVR